MGHMCAAARMLAPAYSAKRIGGVLVGGGDGRNDGMKPATDRHYDDDNRRRRGEPVTLTANGKMTGSIGRWREERPGIIKPGVMILLFVKPVIIIGHKEQLNGGVA